MLFFIPSLGRHEDLIRMFQYISCYSLSLLPVRHLPCVEVSIHLMLFFIRIAPSIFFPNASSFNTSHVILYRYDLTWGELTWEFQYISCYSLSNMFPARNKLCNMVSIHLMLFFIEWLVTMPLDDWSFNTSHVILYRRNERSEHDTEYVSIHLMLFFINNMDTLGSVFPPFQYISCYSLSKENIYYKDTGMKFQYISCYSLSCSSRMARTTIPVSIHLMLFFILFLPFPVAAAISFQYISCYSLSDLCSMWICIRI